MTTSPWHKIDPSLLDAQISSRNGEFSGRFRATTCYTRVDDESVPDFVTLEDISGSVVAAVELADPEDYEVGLLDRTLCYVEGAISRVDDRSSTVVVRRLHEVRVPEEPLLFVPGGDCCAAARPHLFTLAEIARELTIWPLRYVFEMVLSDPLNAAFFTAGASGVAHHADPGGLLRHSIECAQIVSTLRPWTNSEAEFQLCLAAAILHDVSKARMIGPGVFWDVRHDDRVLEVLGPALAKYSHWWPKGFEALRLLLVGRGKTHIPHHAAVREILAAADRISAISDGSQTAFERLHPNACFAKTRVGPVELKYVRVPDPPAELFRARGEHIFGFHPGPSAAAAAAPPATP